MTVSTSRLRRNHITQKVRSANQRTLYIPVDDDQFPTLSRVKGTDCTLELIDLYDVIGPLLNIALQHDAPLEKLSDLLTGA